MINRFLITLGLMNQKGIAIPEIKQYPKR